MHLCWIRHTLQPFFFPRLSTYIYIYIDTLITATWVFQTVPSSFSPPWETQLCPASLCARAGRAGERRGRGETGVHEHEHADVHARTRMLMSHALELAGCTDAWWVSLSEMPVLRCEPRQSLYIHIYIYMVVCSMYGIWYLITHSIRNVYKYTINSVCMQGCKCVRVCVLLGIYMHMHVTSTILSHVWIYIYMDIYLHAHARREWICNTKFYFLAAIHAAGACV